MEYHISRWRYLWAYLVILLLVLFSIWLNDRAVDVPAIIALVVAVMILIVFEVRIRSESLVITSERVEYRKNKHVSKIEFADIVSVSTSQSVIKHLLKYGDLKICTNHGDFKLIGFQDVRRLEKIINKEVKK